MTNSKDFLNKLESAYIASIRYAKWQKINILTTTVIVLSTGFYFLYINSVYLFFIFLFTELTLALYITFKLSYEQMGVCRSQYVGQLSELFDLSHPVIKTNNEALIKEIKENKYFSGSLIFDIYCSIKNYYKNEESKFIINNTPYDKDYLNKLVEQNVKDLETYSN